MNLHHLAVFHAVAESGSISAAAERLHISQPAISRQVREFEDTLDTVLFDRLPRGMRPTAAGETLAGYARRIFALEGQAETAMADLREMRSGHLSVGASTTIGNYLLPRVLAALARDYPGIRVTLEVGNTDDIQAQLLDDRLDVGLTEGLVESDELRVEVFLRDQLVVVAGAGTDPRPEQPYTIEELGALPWITREHGSGTRAVLERVLADRGLAPREVMALASTEAIKGAVAAGAGIAVVSSLTVAAELQRGDLVELATKDFPRRRPLHLLQRHDRRPSHAGSAFLGLLSELVTSETKAPSG